MTSQAEPRPSQPQVLPDAALFGPALTEQVARLVTQSAGELPFEPGPAADALSWYGFAVAE